MIRANDINDEFTDGGVRVEPAKHAQSRSILSRIWHGMISAQEARAERLVHGYMARQDEESLKRLGLSVDEIQAIRRQGRMVPLSWI
jgi:hypothetical protein